MSNECDSSSLNVSQCNKRKATDSFHMKHNKHKTISFDIFLSQYNEKKYKLYDLAKKELNVSIKKLETAKKNTRKLNDIMLLSKLDHHIAGYTDKIKLRIGRCGSRKYPNLLYSNEKYLCSHQLHKDIRTLKDAKEEEYQAHGKNRRARKLFDDVKLKYF
jgi:hypothetical protein